MDGLDGRVTVTFTHDEALVLFEYLSEYGDTNSLKPKDQAEQVALWKLEGYFQSVLVEPIGPGYMESVNAARARLRQTYHPGGFPVLGTWGTEDGSPRAEGLLDGPTVNKQSVQRCLDAYGRFDHETILSLLTDDIEWVIPGAFVKAGKAEFDAEIEAGDPPWPPEITITRLTEQDDVVIAEGTVLAPRADAAALKLAFCDVFEMRDAKIRRLISYLVPFDKPDEAKVDAK
jgi:ketosteroid isomerase-like protein